MDKDTARMPQARTETYLKYGFVIMEHEYLYCPECGDVLNAGPAYQQPRCARCGQKISYDGIEWKKDKLLGYLEKGGPMHEQVKDRVV